MPTSTARRRTRSRSRAHQAPPEQVSAAIAAAIPPPTAVYPPIGQDAAWLFADRAHLHDTATAPPAESVNAPDLEREAPTMLIDGNRDEALDLVRDYGTAAVVVGVQAQEASFQGGDNSGRFRLTLVAVRPAERWLVAGVHIGPLQGPAGPSSG
jgi:hypothetical protein